jgi:sugar phosphate isomerase/epimerase
MDEPMIHVSAFADEISEDPAEQMDVLKSLAIHHIEFRSILGINVLDLDDAQHAEFRDLLKARRFTLSAIGSPIGKIKIVDPFEPHLERLDRALELADFYSCPRVRIFSYYIPEGDTPEQHRDEVMRRMAEKARIAEGRGISLLLENEKGIYGDTAARVSDILETVNSPGLAHAFDPANYLEVGQDIDEAWALLRPRVKHFHVKDYKTLTRTNVPCGEGDGQIARLIADAVANGYSGYAVLEPHLKVAAAMYGFTGPEKFGEAARALQDSLRSAGVFFDGP